jgi:RNA polymerase sigma-70 factor (ECF subfamily)
MKIEKKFTSRKSCLPLRFALRYNLGMPKDAVSGEVTRLLRSLSPSTPENGAKLYEVLYTELRRLAAHRLRKERPGHTLSPTALVNEAWLRLADDHLSFENKQHFMAIAATAMRRILVDYARARQAEARGGGHAAVTLDEFMQIHAPMPDRTILDLEDALEGLHKISPRAAQVIEMRFYGGMTEAEVASYLGVTRRTVNRDWDMARAWLFGELNRSTNRHVHSKAQGA